MFLFEEKTPHFNDIKSKVQESAVYLIEKLSVKNFVSGMDIGFEQFAAETILELKERYPQITLEGVLPHEMHSINWSTDQRKKYYSIMEKSDREVLLQYHYTDDCMRKRNLYMINKSKHIIFFKDGTGSIDSLILFTKAKGRNVIVIDSGRITSMNKMIY
ncbi:MAG TPA: DUF1273 domain-containing protein [Clostridiales bacterium]|nr:DUF1273 domain-containing protein [Clostridiales bacterium]